MATDRLAARGPHPESIGAAGWIWSVRVRLPAPIARRWSGGQADGFSELPAIIAMTRASPLLVATPLALIAIIGRPPLVLRRSLGATSLFLLVFMAAISVDSIRVQLDVPDATAAAPPPDAPGLTTVPEMPWEAEPCGVDTAAALTVGLGPDPAPSPVGADAQAGSDSAVRSAARRARRNVLDTSACGSARSKPW